MDTALKSRENDPLTAELDAAKRRIGEISVENELLREKIRKGHKVGRKRVLRIMRENHLLSPYRVPQGAPNLHEGKIITFAPNVMWGTDGTKVFTLEDGWCWLFTAVGHWNYLDTRH